jgi:hypothetical protein
MSWLDDHRQDRNCISSFPFVKRSSWYLLLTPVFVKISDAIIGYTAPWSKLKHINPKYYHQDAVDIYIDLFSRA